MKQKRSRPPDTPHRTIGVPTRERGRLARIHSRSVPLSFPAMRHPATLPAPTAWARPEQSPSAVAGRAGWRSSPRLCQDVCGRDARAPGWAASLDLVAPSFCGHGPSRASHRALPAPVLRSATRRSRQRRLSGLDRLIPSSMDAKPSMAVTRVWRRKRLAGSSNRFRK